VRNIDYIPNASLLNPESQCSVFHGLSYLSTQSSSSSISARTFRGASLILQLLSNLNKSHTAAPCCRVYDSYHPLEGVKITISCSSPILFPSTQVMLPTVQSSFSIQRFPLLYIDRRPSWRMPRWRQRLLSRPRCPRRPPGHRHCLQTIPCRVPLHALPLVPLYDE